MRILLAHKLYDITGGAEVFFRETERILRQKGHDTLMVSTGLADETTPENVHLLKAPAYQEGGPLSKLANLPNAIYDHGKRRAVAKLVETFKPDIMHTFSINVHLSPSINDAANAAGVPLVGTCNDYKHICPNYKLFHSGGLCYDCKNGGFWNAAKNNCCHGNRALSLASSLEAYVHRALKTYQTYSHFTFSSDYMAQITARFWQRRGYSWSKLRNPMPKAFHQPSRLKPPTSQNYGLYFGRLVEEKGVDRIIHAASEIDRFPLKIVGDGPELISLKNAAAVANLSNLEFIGPLWGEALKVVLEGARFVIVPSLWHENFPYVITQAFAAGKPVIGSRRGGIVDLIDHETTGLLFDPDDASELAKHIQYLASNESKARAMGSAAKKFADRNFSDEDFYDELMEAYARGADAHHRRRR